MKKKHPLVTNTLKSFPSTIFRLHKCKAFHKLKRILSALHYLARLSSNSSPPYLQQAQDPLAIRKERRLKPVPFAPSNYMPDHVNRASHGVPTLQQQQALRRAPQHQLLLSLHQPQCQLLNRKCLRHHREKPTMMLVATGVRNGTDTLDCVAFSSGTSTRLNSKVILR